MTAAHTPYRVLIGGLVIAAGLIGGVVGSASAEGLSPAAVTVSADEVAGGTVVNGTASIPVQGAAAGDTIVIRQPTSAIDAGSITGASSSHPDVSVTHTQDVGLFGDDQVTVEFADAVADDTVDVTISMNVDGGIADEAETYHDETILEIESDATGTNSDGDVVFDLSVAAAGVAQADLTFDGAYAGVAPSGADVYQTPFGSETSITAVNVTDEYGNDIYEDDTTDVPDDAVTLVLEDPSIGYQETYDTDLTYLIPGNVHIFDGGGLSPPTGLVDVSLRLGDETGTEIGHTKLAVYPENVGLSINKSATSSLNETEIAVMLNTSPSDLGSVDISLESPTQSGGFDLVAGENISHRFALPSNNQTVVSVYGDAGVVDSSLDITSNGTVLISVTDADPGNYTLAVDVMPSVAHNATRDTVEFRVYGAPTNATGECNRPFVGTVRDPDPVSVRLKSLRDATGQSIDAEDVWIDAVGIANRSLQEVNQPASALPLTVGSVDPTALPASDIGTGSAPVSVNLTWTANGSTHARWIPVDTVDIVHEVASPATEASNWTPVTAPMPYERIVYEDATTGPDGRPLAVRWQAGEGYVPFETAAHARSHLASGWFVAGATRVGYVYADTGPVNRTLELHPGWHHLGPPTDLTRQAAWAPVDLLAGTNRTGHYNGVAIAEPDRLQIPPYDTYWLQTNTTCEYRVPGAHYDPTGRAGGDGT